MFHKLQQEPPPGFRFVTQDQLIRADRALWLKVAEETRARVQSSSDGKKSVDVAIEKWSMHPEVQYYIMPMPQGSGAGGNPKKDDKPIKKDDDPIKTGDPREKEKERTRSKCPMTAPSRCLTRTNPYV